MKNLQKSLLDIIKDRDTFVIYLIFIVILFSLAMYGVSVYFENAEMFTSFPFKKNPYNVYKFKHKMPKKRYSDVVDEFGAPDFVQNKPGGVAIWKQPDFFERIMLLDESIKHKSPKPHCDFLYSTVKVHIPFDMLEDVLKLSKSVKYDQLKGELTVRCHTMKANIPTINLVMKIVNGEDNVHDEYGPLIMKTMNDKKFYTDLYLKTKNLVKQNQIKYEDTFHTEDCTM